MTANAPKQAPAGPDQDRAHRDVTGHGRHIPHADWPGGARIAVQFVLNYEEGAESPKLMSAGLHCRIIGRPGRTAALRKFVDYIKSKSHVWIARRSDVARHWHARHPAKG